jgi:hypothetical protein
MSADANNANATKHWLIAHMLAKFTSAYGAAFMTKAV